MLFRSEKFRIPAGIIFSSFRTEKGDSLDSRYGHDGRTVRQWLHDPLPCFMREEEKDIFTNYQNWRRVLSGRDSKWDECKTQKLREECTDEQLLRFQDEVSCASWPIGENEKASRTDNLIQCFRSDTCRKVVLSVKDEIHLIAEAAMDGRGSVSTEERTTKLQPLGETTLLKSQCLCKHLNTNPFLLPLLQPKNSTILSPSQQ